MVTHKGKLDLSLAIIEQYQLELNVSFEEIQSEDAFNELLASVVEIAHSVKCSNYYICPEFNKEAAFIVNGKLP